MKITKHNDGWWKIDGDDAFDSILGGYPEYEKVFLDHVPKGGAGTAIQAGGYCGIFPRMLAQHFKTVYTFEPDAGNFTCLVMNISEFDNVIPMRSFLGDRHRVQGIRNLLASNRGMNVGTESGFIPTLKIDDLAAADVDYIQLDTEGSEDDILYGAVETISNYHPLISVEDDHNRIQDFMRRMNYKQIATVYRDTFYEWAS